MKILLVEDDDTLIKVLTHSLTAHHYVVDVVKDGELGWTYGSTFEYDLMVLDVVLPKLDGISLCKRFRDKGYATPILLLTAQDARTVKVQGLDAGADDYVVKPFDPVELMARIRAILRRSSTQPFPLLTWGDLLLNPSTCEVSYNGQALALTTKEYELLELFLRDSQYVFSSDELIDRLWSSEEFPSEATVRSHIRRVRQKLAAVGAPADFIATLHGRGYYLKTIDPGAKSLTSSDSSSDSTSGETSVGDSAAALARLPLDDRSDSQDPQQQYLTFLNQTWVTTQPQSLEQVTVLSQSVTALQNDRLTPLQQAAAKHIAHTLVGTLGIFGLTKITHLVRQLDSWLGSREPLQPHQAPLMQTLVTALQQEIQSVTRIQLSQIPDRQFAPVLLVSADLGFNQALESAAARCGIWLQVVPTLADLERWEMGLPQVVLLRWQLDQTRLSLAALQTIVQCYPTGSVVVVGDRDDWTARLEVMRRGGTLFLSLPTEIDRVMTSVVALLKEQALPAKVMVVDDDRTWLTALPTLLKPWDFKVTTLAEPQQFWQVLQSVTPDVLILDVTMPQVNGFELCQVLRSDPDWQRLPVLFLSVLNDTASQEQAFAVGADDYLCKPMTGAMLAHRILNRLDRVRAQS
jgi:DNA-binding response OmpR family regulator